MKTGALAKPSKFVSRSQSIDCSRAKCTYRLLFIALFQKRDALGFSQNVPSIKSCNLFIDDGKLMVLSWSMKSEVERCVSSARPDWLITSVTHN